MALQPLPPIPNTRLVDDPARDAIWRRYLEQVFALLSQVNNTGVVGPGASTDNAVARWNGTTGQTLQNSGVIIDDSNSVSGVSSFTAVQITDSALTAGRVVYAGTGGLLSDNAALAYAVATSTLTATNISSVTMLSSSTATLPLVNIDGGNIDSTAIGANTASTGVFTNISSTGFFTSTSVFDNVSTRTLFATSSVTFNSLTATRVPFAGTSGLLTDSADLTYTTGTSTLAVVGVVSLPDGAAATPSLKVGDEQNGLFSPSANVLGIAVAAQQCATITNSSGNRTLLLSSGTSGATALIDLAQTSNTASSIALHIIRVAGATANDPYTRYTVTGVTNWAVGIDNSDSDSYKISQNATLGTNDYLTITTGGVVGLPTVNIDGGNIDGTAIGAATASTGVYTNVSTTTLFSTSTATLPLVNIDGGNIDSTAIGAATSSTGVFTNVSTATLFTSGNATIGDAAADTLTINAETVSKPNIPCFASNVSSTINNVTGAGTSYTVIFHASRYDQSGDFNTGTGTFTASVTGKYNLCAQIRIINIPAGSTSAFISIVTSNATWTTSTGMSFTAGTFIAFPFQITAQADMDAGDTATVVISVSAGAGDTADVAGSTSMITYFTGVLSA